MAPQVGLEQSRLIQPLAQIHIDFVTNIGKSKGYITSPLPLTGSSEIAKIARMGSRAVQKQYIFRPAISNSKLVWLTFRPAGCVHPDSLQGTALSPFESSSVIPNVPRKQEGLRFDEGRHRLFECGGSAIGREDLNLRPPGPEPNEVQI